MLVAHSVMKDMGFAQMPGGVDDYFEDVTLNLNKFTTNFFIKFNKI